MVWRSVGWVDYSELLGNLNNVRGGDDQGSECITSTRG